MEKKKIIPITALGQAVDGKIYINEDRNEILSITDDIKIFVSKNRHVTFLDKTKNKNITLIAEPHSHIKYMILDSCNSERDFHIQGSLDIVEVALEETIENTKISLENESAECFVKCLCISSNTKNHFTQNICHNAKNTISNISNVAVSMNQSNVIFDTTGKIEKGKSLSKCQQLSRGIVMDDSSVITAKPILLIDEYDCFANHGASIGKMSDEDLFYLMSRGLSKKDAFLLILQGIIAPFISSIEIEELKDKIEVKVSNLIEK